MKSPIVVIVFNRPDHTIKLLEGLQAEQSRELFVISDGPREDKPDDAEKVEYCRRLFKAWPGKVHFNFAEKNVGCKARVSSGLNWVFKHSDRAIILEDDCFPHPGFFQFCDELLEYYSNCKEVMSVCGTKTFPGDVGTCDLFFSKYNNCWGWATWKRAWTLYDEIFTSYSSREIMKALRDFLGSNRAALYWYYLLRKVLSGKLNSWAYCWMITCFLNRGFHIYPSTNLVTNSGFGLEATHTKGLAPYMPQSFGVAPSFPLKHPENITACSTSDKWIEDHMYSKSFFVRAQWVLSKFSQ